MPDKLDEMVSQVENQIDSVKKQLFVCLVREQLPGQDWGAVQTVVMEGLGGCSIVCNCVVGKSCACEFQNEECDIDCCDHFNKKYQLEETDE